MMTSVSPIHSGPSIDTDIAEIWKTAICRYEETIGTGIESLTKANTLADILNEIHDKESMFKSKRHDGSKTDKFRSLVSKTLYPIEKIGEIVAQASSSSFPPSVAIFTAMRYLINIANSVSADYDKVVEFFEELERYLKRLKILEGNVPPILELKHTLAEILISVLVLCGISAKYVKRKRIVKAFRNLISGEDDELTSAYSHFQQMVEQEQRMISNATLAGVMNIKKGTEQLLNSEELLGHDTSLERENVLIALSSLSFHEKQRDTFAKHREGTGEWVLLSDEFQEWLIQTSTLWCYGMPGGGKTVITSIIINYISEATEGTNVAVAYLYCDYKNERTQSESELLSNIARQLTEQTRSIPSEVREFRSRNAEKKRSAKADEWISLIEVLCLSFQKVFIIVDALDECPEKNRDEFLRLIKKLESSIHLFITSRPFDFPIEFANLFKIEIFAQEFDIRTFLETEINSNYKLSKIISKDLRMHTIEHLTKNASGMFLLARLQIDLLSRQRTTRDVKKTMSILPKDIEGYYHEAMKRIENQGEQDFQIVKKAFSFIVCARTPLTVEELRHAMSVEPEDTELDDDAFLETEILVEISTGLIRVDEESRTIGLVHHTLHEYLEKYPKNLLPDPDAEIARACLTYLSFDVFGSGPCSDGETLKQRLQTYQFLEYASHNWGHHMRKQLPGEMNLILAYIQDSQKLISSVQVLHVIPHRTSHEIPYRVRDWYNRFPKQFGPLHVGAYWGLEKILNNILEAGINIDSLDSHGATALLVSAKHGHEEGTRLLLKKGANVNAQNKHGETALHWAAKKGHNNIVELLLKEGADIIIDDEGWTPLNWAVVIGSTEITTALFAQGVDLDAGIDGRNKALFLAAEEGHDKVLQKLLNNGASVNAKDDWGSTALDFAVSAGKEPTVRALLQNRADINSRDVYGNHALHWAVSWEGIVRLLLEAGSNFRAKNDSGQTALCWASQNGSLAVAQLLLKSHADANSQDENGITALHRAALRGSNAMVQLLLDNGANPNVKDNHKWTPLHGACVKQHAEVVQLLLNKVDGGRAILDSVAIQKQDKKQRVLLVNLAEQKGQGSTVLTGLRFPAQEGQVGRLQMMLEKGADANSKDAAGYTALELAAFQGHEEAVQLLLENGADANLLGSGEFPPLYFAIQQYHEKIVSLLIEHGADANATISDVNANIYGSTMIMLAADLGNMAITQYLVKAGADVKRQDYSGKTVLHFAALNGRENIVQLLIKQGVDLNIQDDRGNTALMLTVENLQHAVLKLLLDTGASMEVTNRDGFTAIHLATFMNDRAMLQLLLDSGANINAKTRDDLTPLHIAALMGLELVQLLLERGADIDAEVSWSTQKGVEHAQNEAEFDFLSRLLCDLSHEQKVSLQADSQYGLTARRIAAIVNYPVVQQLLQ